MPSMSSTPVVPTTLAHSFSRAKPLTSLRMTREEKIERYIDSVVQNMDLKTMYHYVYESIEEELKGSTDEQIDEMYNYHFEDQ